MRGMEGVDFGGKHTYFDWGLILRGQPTVSTPKIKARYVDIPGADGALDLTEALCGRPTYEMRTIEVKLVFTGDRRDWQQKYEDVLTWLHGKTMEITLDSDREHYFKGRCEVDAYASTVAEGEMVIRCKVQPYRYSRHDKEGKVL